MRSTCSDRTDLYVPELATVLTAEAMTAQENFLEFQLASGEELGHMPGQFVEVSLPGYGEAPISVSSSPTIEGRFQMVVRKMGNVTGAIHRLSQGDEVGIRGPYGTHFPVDGAMKGRDLLFICGGIGLVPVRSAIQYVLDNREDYGDVTILFGCKAPCERLFLDELIEWEKRDDVLFLETVDRGDEGWEGNVGVITTLLPHIDFHPEETTAIVCGPPVMYKFVLMELLERKMKHEDMYISLERRMKCGVGKCGHCQINDVYVCQDGPVFCYDDIRDLTEAIQ